MRSFVVLLLALCIQGYLARGIYDDLEEIDLWSRGVPGTAATHQEFAPECIKDILIVWDNSYSVGRGPFLDTIRPFIRKLIKSPTLNVHKDGTNIGVLAFSTQKKTRLLWNVNDYPNEEDLMAKINAMNYTKLMGDGTRTGVALMEANKLFSEMNPYNYRPNVGDVIFLFTDGQPNRRLRAPHFEDTFGFRSETKMASHFANELKKKNITVVGLAAGQNGIINRFYDDLVSWSTYVFRTELTELDLEEVLNKIVAASCKSAGLCGCDETLIREYTKQGREAVVEWPTPILECTSRNPDVYETKVTPEGTKSGKSFEKGLHNIAYSFTYQDGGKLRTQECKVSIEVVECECSPKQTINGVIGPYENKGLVKWTTPVVSCPAVLKKPTGNTEGFFSEGQHTVRYVYTYTSGNNDFEMSCDVDINMKSCSCPTVQKFKAMSAPNGKAFVTWKEPTPNCEVTLVSSDSSSPEGYFTVGEHTRQYTYRHESGFRMTCDVVIEVEACECPPQETVHGVIRPGETKGRATWRLPAPSCPAQLNQPDKDGEGLFSEGEHEVSYLYTHTSGKNTFDLTCDVMISMKACNCPTVQKFKAMSAPNGKAFVTWKEPTPSCEVTLVSSDSASPKGYFTVGKHSRQYTYRHESGFKMTCDVVIEVEACECPPQETVHGVIRPGETKGRATWKIPAPSCPAQLNQPDKDGEGLFSEGEHKVPYLYTYTSGENTFDLTCDVMIKMKECKCPPMQRIAKPLEFGKSEAFVKWEEPRPNCEATLESSDSALPEGYFTVGKHARKYRYRHAEGFEMSCGVLIEVEGELCHGKAFDPVSEVCCCGEVHSVKSGYACCGVEYFNKSTHQCCDEKRANIVPKERVCSRLTA